MAITTTPAGALCTAKTFTKNIPSLILGFLSALCGQALSADVTLAWDSNPEPNVAGYRIMFGSSSQQYTQEFDVGNNTEINLTNLEPAQTYYAVVSAYSVDGLGSPLSEEISFQAAPNPIPEDPPPAIISDIKPAAGGSLELTLSGTPGVVATLQTSNDLTNWNNITDYTIESEPMKIPVPKPSSEPKFYYRLFFN